jgi:hypothetical protein
MRRLPTFILGGLSIVCVIGLYLFHMQQSSEQEALRILAKRLAMQGPVDESSAQKEAIRRRIAFEEHVIELSQPVVPIRSGKPEPEGPIDQAKLSRPPAQIARTISAASGSASVNKTAALSVTASSATAPPMAGSILGPDPKAMVRRALAVASTIAVPSARATPLPVRPAVPMIRVSAAPVSSSPVATGLVSSPTTSVLATTVATTNGSGGQPSSKPIEAPPATVLVAVSTISPQEATKSVPRAFEDAYAKGDLALMMGLFAPDAVNERGGLDAISQDYDHLFRESGKRDLRLVDLSWVVQPDRIAGSGSFVAQIQHSGTPATQVRGWIKIEAISLNGHWKIHRLLHGNGNQ